MNRKHRKGVIVGAGFLIAFLVVGGMAAGLIFWQFCRPAESREEQGDLAFSQGEYAQAVRHWIAANEHIDGSGRLYEKMGVAYLRLSSLDRAESSFKKFLGIRPGNLTVQKQVLRIALIRGDVGGAKKLLSEIIDLHGADGSIMMLSGDIFMLQGKSGRARADYSQAVALLPGQVRPRLKLAICMQAQKKESEAQKIVTRCRMDGVTDPMDLLLLADYYMLVEDRENAERYMLQAIKADPGNIEFKGRLYLFYRLFEMNDKAVTYLKQLAEDYPDNIGFRMQLADIYLSLKDMAGAEQLLDGLKAQEKDALGYHLLMGKYWLLKGRYSHAVSYLKNALQKNYGLVSAHYLMGVACFAGGQVKLAEKAFLNALMLDPGHGGSIMAMAALNYKRGKYRIALQYTDRLLDQDASYADAWQIKGLCFQNTGESSSAVDALYRAWHLSGDASALFFLGQAFEASGKVPEALDSYEDVLEMAPGMSEALLVYGALMFEVGKGRQALEYIDRMMANKGHLGLYYAGAKISLKHKDYDRCRAYLDKAMAKTPAAGVFYLLQADLFQAIGDEEGFETALTNCTMLHQGFLDGWQRLSGYYAEKQEIDKAVDVLEQALKSFPNHPAVMGNLAWLLLEQESDVDRALDLARMAYDQMTDQAWLMDTLGWAYYHKKIYSQAEWMLARAEERMPGKGAVQYHLGLTLYRQGKLSEARDKLESALACDDLRLKDREAGGKVLAGLNGKPVSKDTGEQIFFDPDVGPALDIMTMPDMNNGDEDILQPDWSNLN